MTPRPVPVQCVVVTGGLAGFYDSRSITLDVQTCAALDRFVAGDDSGSALDALLVVTHEALHASLFPARYDETYTECRAMRYLGVAAALLGASPARVSVLPVPARHLGTLGDPVYGRVPCADVDAMDSPPKLRLARGVSVA